MTVQYHVCLQQLLPDNLLSEYRGLLRSVMCDLQCRLDVAVDCTQLQTHNDYATYQHLKEANGLRNKAQANGHRLGIYFRPFDIPAKLATVADASHATKGTSYAQ